MSKHWILTFLAASLVGAFALPVCAEPLPIKTISPNQQTKPQVIKPTFKAVVPPVAKATVTTADPQALLLVAGAPGKEITLGGSGLDSVTGAQLLRNNQPAAGMSVQLLGGPPTSRQIRISALRNAVSGDCTLRLMAGTTRIDVPTSTFSVQVTSAVMATVRPATARAPQPKIIAPPAMSTGKSSQKIQLAEKIEISTPAPLTGRLLPVQPKTALNQVGLKEKLEITNTGSLIVTNPKAGDSWCVEENRKITWTSKGSTYKELKITLASNGSPVKTIAGNAMVLDKSFSWDVSAALGTYQIVLEGRDSNGLAIKGQGGDFKIQACGNVAAMAAASAGSLSLGSAGLAAGMQFQTGKPKIMAAVVREKADVKLIGATLKAAFVPGSVDISGATLARADGGLWLSHDGHTVQAKTIDAEIVCRQESRLTRANVYTAAAPRGAEVRFAAGAAASQRIQFNFMPLVTDAILIQLCPADRQTNQMPFKPLVQAEWVCETDTTVEVNTQSLGNYPATVNCDMTEATASTLEFWRYKFDCPQGYVIEGTSSSSSVSAGNTWEADKNCVRR